MVGVTGFEPAAPCSQSTCATKLRHTPTMEAVPHKQQIDYIMAFDENGTQTACSREYIGFSLPTDESSTFSDFRRLLKGIPSITHDPERDFITGETRAFVGMRFRIAGQDPETPVRNGALLIALPSVEAAHAEEKADLVSEAKKRLAFG